LRRAWKTPSWLPLLLAGAAALRAQPAPPQFRLQVQLAHTHSLSQVAYLPDGRSLLSAGDDTIRHWDVRTGRVLDVLGGFGGDHSRFVLSADGKRLAVVGAGGKVAYLALVPVDNLRSVERIPLGEAAFREWHAVAFHPTDLQSIVLATPSGLVLFDCAARRISATIEKPREATVFSASRDGARVATGSNTEIRVWDVVRKSSIAAVKTPKGRLPEDVIAAMASRGIVRTDRELGEITLSDDGSILAAHLFQDNIIYRWAVPGGKPLPSISLIGSAGAMAISSDNRNLAVEHAGFVSVFDLKTAKRLLSIRPYETTEEVSAKGLSFSRDGAFLAYGTGLPLEADKKTMLGIIDIAGNRVERVFNGLDNWAGEVNAEGAARRILYANYGAPTPHPVWDLNTLSLDLTAPPAPDFRPTPMTAVPKRGLNFPEEWGPTVTALVDSNRTVAVLGEDEVTGRDYLGVFSAADGRLRKAQALPVNVSYRTAAFDLQGTKAWLGAYGGSVQEWDLERMTMTQQWSAAYSDIDKIKYVPEIKCLALTSANSPVITLLRPDSGHMLNLISVDDDWIAYTEDGYFDSSPGGAAFLNVVSGTAAYGIDQFMARLNRPDIILERFGFGTPAQMGYFRRQHDTRMRRLGLTEESAAFAPHVPTVQITAAAAEGRKATVSFSMKDDQSPLLSYQIFVNGVPQFAGSGKSAAGRETVQESIELSDGLNRIEVSCMNRQGAESFREMAQVRAAVSAQPQLFFVGIGVSQYANPGLNLGFADKDALDLAAVFGRMGAPFSKVNVRTFANQDATRAAIQEAATWLAQAGVNDTVAVFLAGHGVHDRDQDATYYFLTHEADPSHLAATSVSYQAIEDLMAGVRARHKLLLLDTCESGEIDDAVFAGYLTNAQSRGVRARAVPRSPSESGSAAVSTAASALRTYLLDRDRLIFLDLTRRTGAVVFSASRGNELSYESETYKNGFFTAGLLRTFTNAAGAKDAPLLSTSQIRQAVKTWVETETGGLQHPTIDRDNVYQSMAFPRVKTEK
jgi:WD40 repeat protein